MVAHSHKHYSISLLLLLPVERGAGSIPAVVTILFSFCSSFPPYPFLHMYNYYLAEIMHNAYCIVIHIAGYLHNHLSKTITSIRPPTDFDQLRIGD